MTWIVFSLFWVQSFFSLGIDPGIDAIALKNRYKKEAEAAFEKGDFAAAAQAYRYLIDSLKSGEGEAKLNLAHCYRMLNDAEQATSLYQKLTSEPDSYIRSVANQQLGVGMAAQKKYEEALELFKEALKADPRNEEARYNYELVKKLMEEQQQNQQDKDDQQQDKEQEQDQQQQEQQDQQQDQQENQQEQGEQDQQQQDQQEQDQQEQEQQEKDQQEQKEQEQQQKKEEEKKDGEQKDAQPQEQNEQQKKEDMQNMRNQRLEEMNISEEKAKMILEALRNQEIQYYQQLKKQPKSKKDPNKPDW
jgi:tetratricopeptide (TPR) repeat protein